MRQWVLVFGCVFLTVAALGQATIGSSTQATVGVSTQATGFSLAGIGSAVVPVTLNKMTNIIFPEAVLTGVKVSRDVMAQKVKGVENVIELKAMRKGLTETNFSVYGKDGRLYSFVLRYSEDEAVLNYRVFSAGDGPATIRVSGLPANEVVLRRDADSLAARSFFLHRVGSSGGLRLRLGGVYVRDSLLWLVFAVRGEDVLRWRFFLQESKAVKRRAMQEVEVTPVIEPVNDLVRGRGLSRVAVGFRPFAVAAGMRLVARVEGRDGLEAELKLRGRLIHRAHDTD